jgi:hypothetical protein
MNRSNKMDKETNNARLSILKNLWVICRSIWDITQSIRLTHLRKDIFHRQLEELDKMGVVLKAAYNQFCHKSN